MQNSSKKIIALMVMCLVVVAACKKKEDDSPQAKLTGKWKMVAFADDANGNGVADVGEKIDWPDSLAGYVVFNANGTGETYDFFGGGSNAITWSLINNNTDLKVGDTSGYGIIHIESLTKTDVVFKEVDTVGGTNDIYWSYFKKQ